MVRSVEVRKHAILRFAKERDAEVVEWTFFITEIVSE